MSQTCANCKFMRTQTTHNPVNHALDQTYSCRYNPPVLAMTNQGMASLFPPTQLTFWCGKWEEQYIAPV